LIFLLKGLFFRLQRYGKRGGMAKKGASKLKKTIPAKFQGEIQFIRVVNKQIVNSLS